MTGEKLEPFTISLRSWSVSTYERPLPFLRMTQNRIMVTNFHGLRIRITRGKQLFTEESAYNDSNSSMNFILEMIVNVLFKLARWMLSINFYYPEEKDDFLQWSTIGEDLESWITKAHFEMKSVSDWSATTASF